MKMFKLLLILSMISIVSFNLDAALQSQDLSKRKDEKEHGPSNKRARLAFEERKKLRKESWLLAPTRQGMRAKTGRMQRNKEKIAQLPPDLIHEIIFFALGSTQEECQNMLKILSKVSKEFNHHVRSIMYNDFKLPVCIEPCFNRITLIDIMQCQASQDIVQMLLPHVEQCDYANRQIELSHLYVQACHLYKKTSLIAKKFEQKILALNILSPGWRAVPYQDGTTHNVIGLVAQQGHHVTIALLKEQGLLDEANIKTILFWAHKKGHTEMITLMETLSNSKL